MILEEVSPAIFGVLSLVVGLAFRFGHFRGAARWYFDEESPWYIRHYPFGLIPFAGMWLFGMAAMLMFDRLPDWSSWVIVSASLFCALLAIVFLYHPPELLKPQWLRYQERDRGHRTVGPEHRGGVWMVIDRFGFATLVVLFGAAFVVAVMMVAIEAMR